MFVKCAFFFALFGFASFVILSFVLVLILKQRQKNKNSYSFNNKKKIINFSDDPCTGELAGASGDTSTLLVADLRTPAFSYALARLRVHDLDQITAVLEKTSK